MATSTSGPKENSLQPTEPNATPAPTTESSSSPSNSEKAPSSETGSASSSTKKVRRASWKRQNLRGWKDRRRKLSNRDFLLIKIAAQTHSLGELAQTFQVDRSWIRRVLESPSLHCLVCHQWKDETTGKILRAVDDARILLWICKECYHAALSP